MKISPTMISDRITVKDINKHHPCYDPTKHFDPNIEYSLIDILSHDTCPPKDKIWVVTRFLSEKTNRLFAVWCAREALKLIDNPDPRSVAAVDTAEKYAYGKATEEELNAARGAALAAIDTARDADDAAYAAAHDATAYAADVAAWHAAFWAVWAATDAVRDAQLNKLKEICYEIIHQ